MQSNIFVKVAPLLKEKKFNTDSNVFLDFLANYHMNDFIYPSVVHRELKMDIKEVYEALEVCTQAGYLEQYLQIYCSKCQRFTGNCYRSALEVPEFINCVHCDEEIENPLQHAVIIYKVIV